MRNNKTSELVLTALFAAIIVIMAFTPLGYIPLVVINATIIHIPVILGSLFCGPKKGGFLGFIFGLTSFIKNTTMPSTAAAFVFSPVLAANMMGVSGVFKSAFICFVPRILVGIIPYFVYIGIRKAMASEKKNIWATILNLLIGLFLMVGCRAFIIKVFEKNPISATVVWTISIVIGIVVFAVLEWYTMKKSGNVSGFVYAGVSGAMINTIIVMGGIYVLYKDAYAEKLEMDPGAVLGVIGGVVSFNGVVESIVAAIIVAALGVVLNKLKPIQK